MQKKLRDYLKYYIGCRVTVDGKEEGVLRGGCFIPNSVNQIYYQIQTDEMVINEDIDFYMPYNDDADGLPRIKPHLRPLSDMTDEEKKEFESLLELIPAAIGGQRAQIVQWTPKTFHYLLSRGFDLFGLIDAGLAIDKSKIT